MWETFCDLTKQARAAGLEDWAARSVFEVMRWQTDVTRELEPVIEYTDKGERVIVRLNNNLHPYYARLYNMTFDCQLFVLRALGEDEPRGIINQLLPGQTGYDRCFT